MTKRLLFVSFLLAFAGFSSLSALSVDAEAFPSSVLLSWDGTDGAVYYDVYTGERFLARLGSGEREYRAERLLSDTTYNFSVAARTEANETLAADFTSATTTSWDGVYEWVNKTDKDNKGRVKGIRIRIETAYDEKVGQYHNVYMYKDDGTEVKIFPLYDFSDSSSGEWVDYNASSPAAISYRFNAERFNTSPFKPVKWRVDKVVIDYDSSSAYIQTSALGLVFETVSGYELYIEDGEMKLSFHTEGSGMVSGVLFRNPNPGEGDAFILTKIG